MQKARNPLAARRGGIAAGLAVAAIALMAWALGMPARAAGQEVMTNDPPQYGPYSGVFLAGGLGLTKDIRKDDTVLLADSPWTLYCWVKFDEPPKNAELVAGLGDPAEEYPRYIELRPNQAVLWMGAGNELAGAAELAPKQWHFLAASFDGAEFHLFADGREVANGKLLLGSASPQIGMAPVNAPGKDAEHFGGEIAALTVLRRSLSEEQMRSLYGEAPNFALVEFEEASKSWPVQTHAQAGYRAPQDPATMPVSKAPFSKPVAHRVPSGPDWSARAAGEWEIAGGWRLRAAPEIHADGPQISRAGFDASNWLPAVVPGTALTTLVARGIYPDPAYGLNNMAIPESLNKQDYWYRAELDSPAGTAGKRLELVFQGINYGATVWLNGQRLGAIKGAFIRGVFDVTSAWKTAKGARNALAVEISPPPHPGIPNEQSIKGGPGENGGIMVLDGPTFMDTEGWDWIPGVRDRDIGIWQPVELKATGDVEIGDPQVITKLPLPDTSRAEIEIRVPLENESNGAVRGTLKASFEGVAISKEVALAPGAAEIRLTPAEFHALSLVHPRLWWPNGYGPQNLYHLKLAFENAGAESDEKQLRFGIREITYELSLLDTEGNLRRVEIDPTLAPNGLEGVVNVTHDGIRSIPNKDPVPPDWPVSWRPGWVSWVASLAADAENSPAVKPSDDTGPAPYLVIKVNGVRIACRGGNWGMDDFMKRVSRARLEPYFKLHHDAHLNIIRNWMGQNTEEVFYDLADEYGLLIWNDFWETTQDDNLEPEDPQLWLANARDAILRYRNHPSIAVWCGRNEGVPQPVVNEGMITLTSELDGTRYYAPSSNSVNLQFSGPYRYMDPRLYFTRLDHGFSVEMGTPSMPTLESFRSFVPKPDRWPIDDVWAYHDWHESANGDVHPFMQEIQAEFGAATGLEDFERKAQMLDYVDHRAIFEGMNAHLWAPNSARLLWMSQPAWPSTMWQILSHDYDTQSSYYAVKKACEPLHIQMDLSDYEVDAVNMTMQAVPGATLHAGVFSLGNKLLASHEEKKDLPADSTTTGFPLGLAPLLASHDVVLVQLELRNEAGQVLSRNLYWMAAESANYRALDRMGEAQVSAQGTYAEQNGNVRVRVGLKNTGDVAALETKLTLLDASGARILPAYYSDNYVSLLPGESREVEIEYPARHGGENAGAWGEPRLTVRGWNLTQQPLPLRAAQ